MANIFVNAVLIKALKTFRSTTPSWIIFNLDLFICGIALVFAYLLRFNFSIPAEFSSNMSMVIIIVLIIRAILFLVGRTYAMIVRHTGLGDVTKLIIFTLIGSLVVASIDVVYKIFMGRVLIPISVVMIDFFISAYLMTATRLIIKFIFIEFRNNSKVRSNVVIYGTDQLAIATKRALDLDTEVRYRVIAFVDDKKQNHKKNIEGINIYPIYKLEEIFEKNSINSLIIAKDHINSVKKNQIIEKSLNYKIKVLTAPKIKSWISGDFTTRQLKQINIEDLLERETITLDSKNILEQLKDKVVMVTGAAGSIGSEIVRQIANYSPGSYYFRPGRNSFI